MRRKKQRSGTYKVGKGRPPQLTRWKPGQSGNPKGRPKGSRPIGAVLQEIIRQKISVVDGDKKRRISALEVMIRRLTNEAIRSDPRAIKLLLSLVDRYGDAPESTIETREIMAEDKAILAEYLRRPDRSSPKRLPKVAAEDDDDVA